MRKLNFGRMKNRLWAFWTLGVAALFIFADSPNAALVLAFIVVMEQARDLDKLAPSDFEQRLAELGRIIVSDMVKSGENVRFTGPGVISQATREGEINGTLYRITVSALAKEPVA